MSSRNADWGKRLSKKPVGTTVALDDELVVPVSADDAWARLEDVPFVASCLPGLDLATLRAESDTVYRATMVNSVMGISANWDLTATIAPEPERRHLTVQLAGEDPKLHMTLNGTAEVTVLPHSPGEATLDYVANLRIEGSLAAMGGPVIRTIVADSIDQFVTRIGNVERPAPLPWHRRTLARIRAWWRGLRHHDTEGTR